MCRFQQFTAPVMAKAMEDTASYRCHRLVSLNDVGADPRQFGLSAAAFHNANQARERHLPHTLLGTSTHDSKRSADARARLDVLSGTPQAWALALERWCAMAQRQRHDAGAELLERNDLYLLRQTLVGVWPLGRIDAAQLGALRERVHAYLLKALREAKQRTSWVRPDEACEAAAARTVDALLGQLEPNPFASDFAAFVAAIAPFGCCNSLSMLALKSTSPGVPDIYQGDEAWNFSLVDPDNRRAVDFDALRRALAGLEAAVDADGVPRAGLVDALWHALPDGRLKLYATWRLLQLRRRRTTLFGAGRYRPLAATGVAADHVVAFAREHDAASVVTIAADAPLAWRDVFSGRRITVSTRDGVASLGVADVLDALPIAVLEPTV